MATGITRQSASREAIGRKVLEFYRTFPFNVFTDPTGALPHIVANPLQSAFPDLHRILSHGARSFLDVGCGAGWLAQAVLMHYGIEATGIDFSLTAIEAAKSFARSIGAQEEGNGNLTATPRFEVLDLFDVGQLGRSFDVICAMGVLHHTGAPREAAARLLDVLAHSSDARLYLGLYHEQGRRPFLDHFRELRSTGATDDELFARFKEMNSGRVDDAHLRSWYRDQVHHPHETHHSLTEVWGWVDELGLELESTSINRYAPFDSRDELLGFEAQFMELSRRRNSEGNVFFPGFFTVCLKRGI